MAHAPTKPMPAPPSAPLSPSAADEQLSLTLRLPEQWALTDECMVILGESNESLGFERTAEGALHINFPPGFPSSESEATIGSQVVVWRFAEAVGRITIGTGGYSLPDGSLLVPDTAWTSDERLAGVEINPSKPMPAVPDFVLEVRSFTQNIRDQQDKMRQWMTNGVRLGWLVDPFEAKVWIYREDEAEPQFLEHPDTLSGENVMAGLTVDLTRVWSADND